MSRFNELLHGDLETMQTHLSGDVAPLSTVDLQAVLSNIVNHMIRFEEAYNQEHDYAPL